MAKRLPTPAEDAVRLRRIMLAATARTRREILDPPGGSDSAKAFNVSRAAARLSDLETYLAKQNVAAQGIVDAQVRAQYAAGARRAERLAREAGLVRADSPVAGGLAGADTARAAVLSRTYRADINKAFDSMGVVAGRSIREVHALGLDNAKLRRVLAGGVISGMPQETRDEVKKLADQAAIGGFVEVPNKRTGRVTRIRPDAYADLVYQTATREATNIAELERLQERQSFYVKIIGSNSTNFCTVYRGKVFYFGPGDDPLGTFPHLRSLPHGGAPFHPRCTKAYVPFNPRTASPREIEAAKPTPEVLATVGKTSGNAQRTFEQQSKTTTTTATPPTPRTSPTPAPAPEPLPAVVPASRDVAAAVEAVDRSEITMPDVRRVVDDGLADVASAGRELPRAVRVVPPSARGADVRPVAIDVRLPATLFVDPRWPHWSDAGEVARAAHAAGVASTPDASHAIVNAAGQSLLLRAVGVARFRELTLLPILRLVTLPERAAIEAEFSTFALTSPAAFIGEVFAMIVAGLRVSPAIMAIYQRLGGP